MKAPGISIITPSFNQAIYLEECLDSILSQNYPALELIVVDGGSTDHSVEIIKKYERHIHWWVSEKDRGQSHAINKGIGQATGQVFNWINSDDRLEKDSLRVIGEMFEDTSTNVVCGSTRIFGEGKEILLQPNVTRGAAPQMIWSRMAYNQHGTFIRLDRIKEIGGVIEDLHFCMDKAMWIRYLSKYGLDGCRSTGQVLAGFRFQPDSKTATRGGLFDKEYAGLLADLCERFSLQDFADLIRKKYDAANRFKFSAAGEFVNKEIVKQMAAVFLLHHSFRIFNEEDFHYAKELHSHILFDELVLEPPYISEAEKFRSQMKIKTWNGFRLRRKLNHLLGRK